MGKRGAVDVFRADTGNLRLFVRILDMLMAEPSPEIGGEIFRSENAHSTTGQDDVGRTRRASSIVGKA